MPYYDDDGNLLDPITIPMPRMCVACGNKDDPHEEVLCNLNRLDQRDEKAFKGGAIRSFDIQISLMDNQGEILRKWVGK